MSYRKFFIFIIIIFLLSLAPLRWFPDARLIAGGDFNFPFHPLQEMITDSYVWNNFGSLGLGYMSRSIVELFPYDIAVSAGDFFGLSLQAMEKGLFILLLFCSGLSMFCLIFFLTRKNKWVDPYWAGFFGALFYMFNTFTLFFKWPTQIQSLFGYIFFPLVLLLFIRGIKKKNNFIYALGIALLLLLSAPSASTPTYWFLFGIILFFYFLIFNLRTIEWQRFKTSLFFSLKVILFTTLLNLWWILPNTYTIFQSLFETFAETKSYDSYDTTLIVNSAKTSIFNVMRLMGFWALESQWNGFPYFPVLRAIYTSIPSLVLSLFIPLIAFSSLFIKKITRTLRFNIVFFLTLAIVSIFFIKGTHEPLSNIIKWFYFNIPGFSMFRSQYEKFGAILALAYSFLFGLTIGYVYGYLEKKNYKIYNKFFVAIIFTVFFIINCFPFWTGQIIADQRGDMKPQRISIPESYQEAEVALQAQPLDAKFMLFPVNHNNNRESSHAWGYMLDFKLSKILNKTVVVIPPLLKLPDQYLNNINNLLKYFALFNIKFVFSDESRDNNSYNLNAKSEIPKALEAGYIKPYKDFDELKIYEINDQYFLPHFYSPQRIFIANETPALTPQLISFPEFQVDDGFVFTGNNFTIDNEIVNKLSNYNNIRVVLPVAKDILIDKISKDIRLLKTGAQFAGDASRDSHSEKLDDISAQISKLEDEKNRLSSDNNSFFTTVTQPGYYDLYLRFDGCNDGNNNYITETIPTIYLNDVAKIIPYTIINKINGDNLVTSFQISLDSECMIKLNNTTLTKGELKIGSSFRLSNNAITLIDRKDNELLVQENKDTEIGFKRISLGRYVMRINYASGSFPLFFNESYDGGWKIYLSDINSNLLKDSKENLFRSSVYYGSRQNHNLYKGHIWDNFFDQPLADGGHFLVNGYANGWWLDLNKFSADERVRKNQDGTYSFDLVIEYLPQRLFYLGIFISIVALIALYLLYAVKFAKIKHNETKPTNNLLKYKRLKNKP